MSNQHEHRKHPRVPIDARAPKVRLHLLNATGQTDSRLVRAIDLSRTGMAFVEPTPVAVGTSVTILLTHASKPLRIIGKVTNCRALPEGGHVMGVRFTSITPIPTENPPGPLTDDPLVDRLLVSL